MQWTEEEMKEGTDADEMVTEPGLYLAEVVFVNEKRTKANNDNMWGLKFCEPDSGRIICWDNLVFSKGGKGIAFKKMAILGVPKEDGMWRIESKDELIGKRVFLNVIVEKYEGKDGEAKERLKVDHHANDTFGYEPLEKGENEDDIPF